MTKFYLIYSIVILGCLAWADAKGYVYESFFTGQGTANKSAQHYHK
jgi:hypothetical protein